MAEKKIGPYIGVTGFMARSEVKEALSFVPEGSRYRLMVGVLMSSKTIRGVQNKWPGRYPEPEMVRDIFIEDNRALNLVHYNTDNPGKLSEELEMVTRLAGDALDGFQLNLAWPDLEQIYRYRQEHEDKYLLLQIGGKAMAEAKTLEGFLDKIDLYQDFIDAVLIDPSGGYGQQFDVVSGMAYLAVLQTWFPRLGRGIAGGLEADNLDPQLRPLIKFITDLSIDTEGKMRTPHPVDALKMTAVERFMKKAFPLLDPQGQPQTAGV